jgi:peptidoglycan/xylan/chitin deacetylase (PgdA/CDA1 family)
MSGWLPPGLGGRGGTPRAAYALLTGTSSACDLRPHLFRLPILTYHAIEEGRSPISVAPALFRRQIEALAEGAWTALTVPQVVELLRLGKRLPPRLVALTFDDGFRSAYTAALPEFREYGFVATIYPVVGRLGRANDWPGQPAGIPTLPLLSWDELGGLVAAGWAVGGHTLTHPDLTALAVGEAEAEIAGGGRLLRDRLGVPVETFAYPYGRLNPAVRAVVAGHYRGGCGTALDFVTGASDPYVLERVDAVYLEPVALVRLLDSVTMGGYLRMRRFGQTLRRLARARGSEGWAK